MQWCPTRFGSQHGGRIQLGHWSMEISSGYGIEYSEFILPSSPDEWPAFGLGPETSEVLDIPCYLVEQFHEIDRVSTWASTVIETIEESGVGGVSRGVQVLNI